MKQAIKKEWKALGLLVGFAIKTVSLIAVVYGVVLALIFVLSVVVG